MTRRALRTVYALFLFGCSGASAASIGGGPPDEVNGTPGDDAGATTPGEKPLARDDAGTSATDAGADGSDGGTRAEDASTDAAPPVDCGAPPALHPSPNGGVFCPFQAAGEAVRCGASAHCCIYPASANKVATCNQLGVACDSVEGVVDFGCDEPSDCPGAGQVCCLKGSVEKDPACYAYGKNVTATVCRPSACAATEAQVCSSNLDCPAGKTCVPFSTRGKELGACR